MASSIKAPLGGSHSYTVIFLHGRGSLGHELAEDLFDSKASDRRTLAEIFPSVKWVFPTSRLRNSARAAHDFPSIAHHVNPMSQWFDIWSIEDRSEKPELMLEGLRESIADLLDVIRKEAKEVPLESIILGGISQGCATAIMTLLASNLRIGGVIGLCGWLPLQEDIANIQLPASSARISQTLRLYLEDASPIPADLQSYTAKMTAIFLAHSRDDEMVPFTQGESLKNTMEILGYNVSYAHYNDGGHWIHGTYGIDDIAAFLKGCFSL